MLKVKGLQELWDSLGALTFDLPPPDSSMFSSLSAVVDSGPGLLLLLLFQSGLVLGTWF